MVDVRKFAVGDWAYDYVTLVLRIGKAVASRTGDDKLLDFHGPEDWKSSVDAKEPASAGELLEEVREARRTLPHQGFEQGRTEYLGKHLNALEALSLRLGGEKLSLEEEAARCFDLDVAVIPDEQFEEALSLYDEGLPGTGDIRERLDRWKADHQLSGDKARLLPDLMERAIDESRRRTASIVPPIEGEEVSFGAITGQPFSALAEYRGSLRSRVLVNTDLPFDVSELLYVACHEGYPGHLAEIVQKEQRLVNELGYVEELVSFLPTPRFVISEGIALWAREVAFPNGEEQEWLEENIYPEAEIQSGGDLTKILAAKDLLWGVWCNAALMLDEGRTSEEVAV